MAYFIDAQKKQQQLQKWGTGPTKMVRPMLPNSYDAREKWRENAGGKMIDMERYQENNRKMYALEDVPMPARAAGNGWMNPNLNESVDIARRYGGQGQAFATASQGLRGAWRMPGVPEAMQGPPMPVVEQQGPPAPTGDAWQRNLLRAPAAAADDSSSQLAARPKAGERWSSPLDQPSQMESRNALGPRALARHNSRLAALSGRRGGRSGGLAF